MVPSGESGEIGWFKEKRAFHDRSPVLVPLRSSPGRDLELRTLDGGRFVVQFGMAINYKKQEDRNKDDK